jgi:prephenate dehydrogenase
VLQRVAIIGLGLIGGSIALGLRRQKIEVVAFDRNKESLIEGLRLGVTDRSADSIAEALVGANLAIIAVPVLAMASVLKEIKACGYSGLLTDVGSVKQPVVEEFIAVYGEVPIQFVPGHPIAGSEKHGVSAAYESLFRQHRVLLTPLDDTDESAVEEVQSLWQSLGAEVSLLTVEHHDSVLAQTSHLPHLLAYALIDTLSGQGDSLEIFEYAAGGLRDFSRIAASDPTMWRDIFMSNRGPLLTILDQYSQDLLELRSVIEAGDGDELFDRLSRSKAARDHFSSLLQQRQEQTEPSEPSELSSEAPGDKDE